MPLVPRPTTCWLWTMRSSCSICICCFSTPPPLLMPLAPTHRRPTQKRKHHTHLQKAFNTPTEHPARMIRTLQRLIAQPRFAISTLASSSTAPKVLATACRSFASAADGSTPAALTARQAASAVIKEIFGGQQSTLSRSARKVLTAPNIGAQVNSW